MMTYVSPSSGSGRADPQAPQMIFRSWMVVCGFAIELAVAEGCRRWCRRGLVGSSSSSFGYRVDERRRIDELVTNPKAY
jgi:hypothetical protein